MQLLTRKKRGEIAYLVHRVSGKRPAKSDRLILTLLGWVEENDVYTW